MRFIKEFFKPVLKCERLKHLPEKSRKEVRLEAPHDYFPKCICVDGVAEFKTCKRCSKVLSGPDNFQETDWWNSVSMPESDWDKIKKDGYLIMKE